MRIRQFAADVLVGRPVEWELPEEGLEKIKLNPEQRRHLYLIIKEALTNVARHSGSGSVRLTIRMDGGRIRAEVRDSGCGFDPSRANGHGLENMRLRAEQLGGAISVHSIPGDGTQITLELPVRRFRA
jgi:signal transduction histidine kinase